MNDALIDTTIVVDLENTEIYVKFSGFTSPEDAITYAEFLVGYLAELAPTSEVVH